MHLMSKVVLVVACCVIKYHRPKHQLRTNTEMCNTKLLSMLCNLAALFQAQVRWVQPCIFSLLFVASLLAHNFNWQVILCEVRLSGGNMCARINSLDQWALGRQHQKMSNKYLLILRYQRVQTCRVSQQCSSMEWLLRLVVYQYQTLDDLGPVVEGLTN